MTSANSKPAKTEVVHQTKECAYCGKPYIRPCQDKAAAKRCGNAKIEGGKK